MGIRGGSVYGKTDPNGRSVVEGQIGPAELFATMIVEPLAVASGVQVRGVAP